MTYRETTVVRQTSFHYLMTFRGGHGGFSRGTRVSISGRSLIVTEI
jgi:hypothetical protein